MNKINTNTTVSGFVLICTLSFGLVFTACPEPEEEPTPPKKEEPIDLSIPLNAGEVRCGKVTQENELIGGVSAYGQVNRGYKCYNNKIRFLIQDGSRPIGASSLGGSLIDVDLVRDNTPESGEDTFKELVSAPGTGEVVPESMEVINDGTNGKAAVIRVAGTPVPNTLLPTAYLIYQDIPGTIQTDYILHPDVSHIEIVTTIFNNTDDFIGPLLMGDFIAMGGGTLLYTPESGFDDVPMFSDVDFVAGIRGEKVSYAYSCPEGPALAPIVEKGITAPVCDEELIVAYEESSTRLLFVGDGTMESVAAPIWQMKNKPLSTVDGILFDAGNQPIANILVSALSKPLGEAGAQLINQTRSNADGSFFMHLPEGNTFVIAHDLTRQRSEEVQVISVADQQESIQLQLQGHGRLVVSTNFFDLDGAPLEPHPSKLSLLPVGDIQKPATVLGELVSKGLSNYHLSIDGNFEANVPPGEYTLYVSRGFNFSRFKKDITVATGETQTVAAELTRAIDISGFVNTEFHQHSLGSIDANVPIPVRVLENAAEGIHFTAATEHDNIVDFQPWVEALGLANFIKAVPGNEVTYTGGIGHFNVYPWDVDPEDPLRDVGSHIWYMTNASTLFSKFRELAGDPLIQINHPRAGFMGYFSQVGLNPVDGSFAQREEATSPVLPQDIFLDWSNNFDVVEVNGDLGSPSLYTEEGLTDMAELAKDSPDGVPAFADYMALLGSGLNVVATGNSDSHTANNNIGYPRSFIRVDKNNFQDWDANHVREAMRQQRAAVGQGCFALLKLGDQYPMGETEILDVAEIANLSVLIQAPSHVSLSRLEIYINGIIQTLTETEDGKLRLDPDGALYISLGDTDTNSTTARYSKTLENLPNKDMIIIALARGGTGLHPTGGGSPFCFSGPTYVDADGNGFDPWLADSQLYK